MPTPPPATKAGPLAEGGPLRGELRIRKNWNVTDVTIGSPSSRARSALTSSGASTQGTRSKNSFVEDAMSHSSGILPSEVCSASMWWGMSSGMKPTLECTATVPETSRVSRNCGSHLLQRRRVALHGGSRYKWRDQKSFLQQRAIRVTALRAVSHRSNFLLDPRFPAAQHLTILRYRDADWESLRGHLDHDVPCYVAFRLDAGKPADWMLVDSVPC
jgi:hypothetical protein